MRNGAQVYAWSRLFGQLDIRLETDIRLLRQAIWEEKVAFDKQIRKAYLPIQRKIQQRPNAMQI